MTVSIATDHCCFTAGNCWLCKHSQLQVVHTSSVNVTENDCSYPTVNHCKVKAFFKAELYTPPPRPFFYPHLISWMSCTFKVFTCPAASALSSWDPLLLCIPLGLTPQSSSATSSVSCRLFRVEPTASPMMHRLAPSPRQWRAMPPGIWDVHIPGGEAGKVHVIRLFLDTHCYIRVNVLPIITSYFSWLKLSTPFWGISTKAV